MLDGTYAFHCACYGAEHIMQFTLDSEEEAIFGHAHLDYDRGFFRRCWTALRYVLGISERYGHFAGWMMRTEDVAAFRLMLDRFEALRGVEGLESEADRLEAEARYYRHRAEKVRSAGAAQKSSDGG